MPGTPKKGIQLLWFTIPLSLSLCMAASVGKKSDEKHDDYKKWLEEDVVYIITPEERGTFTILSSPEEKERFIEQFWLRRDSDLGTPENEFREQHYRRISYANTHFHSGVAGWRTDRGMIYIKHGPPDGIEKHPEGGPYHRKPHEGGGFTSTLPFEVWFYHHLEGVGDGIEIEFVDVSRTNEYRIARDPEEKDALLHVPNTGLTLAESFGLQSRYDRLRVRYIGNQDSSNIHDIDPTFQPLRIRDYPMQRLKTLFNLQKAPLIKFKDLEKVVTTRVSYEQLPVDSRCDLLQISNGISLVPVTLGIKNQDLTYQPIAPGVEKATVDVYGRLENLQGQVQYTFEDTLTSERRESTQAQQGGQLSLYQKSLPLHPGRYKLSLVVRDANSGNLNTHDRLVLVPRSSESELVCSSIILTRRLLKTPQGASMGDPFVLGKYKAIPIFKNEFIGEDRFVQAYLEVYNLALDQSSLEPSVQIEISLYQMDQLVFPFTPIASEYEFSADRLLIYKTVPFDGLVAGKYTLIFRITDQINGQQVRPRVDFVMK